jgi:hypothetical protein
VAFLTTRQLVALGDEGSERMTRRAVALRDQPRRPRPRVGGYRSRKPLTAEEIDAELA